MSHPSNSRGSDSSWVTANTEGLHVETLGPVQRGESLQIPADGASGSASDRGEDSGTFDPSHPLKVKDEDEKEPPINLKLAGQAADVLLPPSPSSCAGNPPDEVPTSHPEKPSLANNGEEEDMEGGSCSSNEDDDMEGLQKRRPRGTCPSPAATADQGEAEGGSWEGAWLTLNKCLLGTFALLCVGFVLFSAPLENLEQQSLGAGEKQSQILDELRDWLKWHAQDSSGDVDSLQAINGLLDRLVKENQEIGLLRVQLQAQKEELQTLLKKSSNERDSAESQQQSLLEENLRLRESVLHEEMEHLSAQDELQALKETLQVLEQTVSDSRNLVTENMNLNEALDAERQRIKDSLILKEMLVAESQMLRQELDKQRMLVASIRHDLDHLSSQSVSLETEGESQQQREMLIKWRNKLVLELQRAESWESSYVENKEKSRGSKPGIHEESLTDPSNTSGSSGAALKTATVPPSTEFSKGPIHGERKNLNKSWEQNKSEHEEGRHGQQHPKWGEKKEDQDGKPGKERTEAWVEERGHQPRRKVQAERENPGDGLHSHRENRVDTDGDQHGKESIHRHHDHNKFWKKLSSHQYRVPEGCTGIPDCARKEGLDLFSTELEPVKKQDFQQLLEKYLEKSNLSRYLPELTSVLSGFFQGDIFSHDQIRFRDFVDDVEDYLEDIARKEKGDDDAVDDFEDYVFRHFYGDAALKKRSTKRDTYQRKDRGGKVTIHPHKSSAGGGTIHKPDSSDEQLDHHNSHKRPHSKEEWSGQHNRKPTHVNQHHHRQESSKPVRERDMLSNHYHKNHKEFNHKQNRKEEKSKQFNHEGRAKHYAKNHQGSTGDSPLPEGRLDYLKSAKEFNHEDSPKGGRSGHYKSHKDYGDKHGGGDHEDSKPFTTRKHHHKERGEE
ncbi:pre-B-cell leukemia transcription factor-interacting protein 1 [Microcaecilia unicolor]|uniref:Pre-B-cell leukemia transcription factor-interacting protein 1 n=1 Tax=Microcaecilia unicolor TaxID=1415580 RepID=A0A6P7WSK8_9AMPH|nr:pre-B-cell leukemia transcription factor-interacting protein 1 [Microcaecilia unicolor]XP_030044171.1 pre-B-cell leukemia transcription factor-interacting protein 1 [Microcaecilia unicolor]XP_030044172.1 pre-B-cell leukemia transcription factor-interacting protein 1 [Microcaecilia unicolor]